MADRWPWNNVRGFKVDSLANGNILVTPDWIHPWKNEAEGGGPGLFTRMRMALWIEQKIRRQRGIQGRPPESQGEKS